MAEPDAAGVESRPKDENNTGNNDPKLGSSQDEGAEYFPRPDENGNGGDGGGEAGMAPRGSGSGSKSFTQNAQNKRSFAAASFTAGQDDRAGRLRRETAIPLKFVIDKIALDVSSGELYTDLLIYIPFLVMFVFFFLAGRNVESNFYVLKGLRDQLLFTEYPSIPWQLDQFKQQTLTESRIFVELDKNFAGIGNTGDWNDWIKDVIVGTIWDCKNPNISHELLAPRGQDYHIGAARIRTLRMTMDSCKVDPDIYPTNGTIIPRACYQKHERDKEEKTDRCNFTNPITGTAQPFKWYDPSSVPGAPLSAVEGVYHTGGYLVEIPFNATCETAQAFGNLLTDSGCAFIDGWATRFVIVEFFVYTPHSDTFHSIKLFTEMLPGGWWYNQYQFRSFQIWTDAQQAQTIFDFFFLVFVAYYWFDYFHDLVVTYRATKRVLPFFLEFWNILELVNLVTFVIVFGLRWAWWDVSRNAKNLVFPFPARYPEHLDRAMVLYNSQVYANSVNTILTFLKLLKYVRLNSRLNVLTRTISMCQQSIVGVLVLFFFVILGYGIAGWTMFGINISGFRQLGTSMSTLVRILVGEMDYESMREENRFLAGAYFWSFVVLALFLLLNFLIAIISEAFAKVSGKAYAQSFDEILLRSIQSMKAFLAPHNVKRMMKNSCAGKSERKMLKKVVVSLEAKLKEQVEDQVNFRETRRTDLRRLAQETGDDSHLYDEAFEDFDPNLVMMMRENWEPYLEEDVYATLGPYFFDYTWDNLMNEYDDAKKSSEEVSKRHMFDTVQAGVEKIVQADMKKVDHLDQLLSQLDDEVSRIVQEMTGEQV